jgi:hypothetical protein
MIFNYHVKYSFIYIKMRRFCYYLFLMTILIIIIFNKFLPKVFYLISNFFIFIIHYLNHLKIYWWNLIFWKRLWKNAKWKFFFCRRNHSLTEYFLFMLLDCINLLITLLNLLFIFIVYLKYFSNFLLSLFLFLNFFFLNLLRWI